MPISLFLLLACALLLNYLPEHVCKSRRFRAPRDVLQIRPDPGAGGAFFARISEDDARLSRNTNRGLYFNSRTRGNRVFRV
ncbi:hypothetical protein B0H66DRAFT_566529 [Apodospora peruviana]|uniref:Secreted protein n=1 Tax=Apodospora peruviana TaxID=516989 RepID=A0AAE0HVD0_9PEZI|nr:hypothetical protein B0H66DRAFT_566529 [Apodospora peruviana]